MNKVRIHVTTTFTATIEIPVNTYQEEALDEVCQYGTGTIEVDRNPTPAEDEVADMLCRNIKMEDWISLKFQITQKENV